MSALDPVRALEAFFGSLRLGAGGAGSTSGTEFCLRGLFAEPPDIPTPIESISPNGSLALGRDRLVERWETGAAPTPSLPERLVFESEPFAVLDDFLFSSFSESESPIDVNGLRARGGSLGLWDSLVLGLLSVSTEFLSPVSSSVSCVGSNLDSYPAVN